ncbi:MAG: hypothetical protein ACI9HE_003983 [Planctomycetota bacterium]|jgi:hypothetical protein
MRHLCKLTLLLPLLISQASAQTITETFDGPNIDDWGIDFEPGALTDAMGGNPGGRLLVTVQSSSSFLPAPMLWARGANHGWGGDWRQGNVQSFQYDRQVELGSSNFGTLPWLLVGNDNGTPADFLDDTWVYVPTGDNFQFGMSPWATFNLPIDVASTTIPAGWEGNILPNSPNAGFDADDMWNFVIQNVSYLGITTSRPWNGGSWFGAHEISFDNFILTSAGFGSNYCGPGNPNSSGQPGAISAVGSPVAADNDLTLVASDLPDGQFAYFLGSRTQGFVANPSGSQGDLCVIGSIARFNTQIGQVVGGSFSITVDLTNIPEPPSFGVSVMAGETWNFQCWHRDFVNGSPTSNFTNAVELSFL